MALPAKSDKQFTEVTARNPQATQYASPMFHTFASSTRLFTPRCAFHRLDRGFSAGKSRQTVKLKVICILGPHYWSSRSFLLPQSSLQTFSCYYSPPSPRWAFFSTTLLPWLKYLQKGSINRRAKVLFIHVGWWGRRSVCAGCVIIWAKCLQKQLPAKLASS